MISDEKARMRREFRAARTKFVRDLDPAGRVRAFARLPASLRARIAHARVIAVYLALGEEADASAIATLGRMSGKTIGLPRIDASGSIDFAEWSDETDALGHGPHGLKQPGPEARTLIPDLIVTPLIAFDRCLSRLGQGKGYYDRAFKSYPDAFRLGIAWTIQEANTIPVEPWDVELHAVLTERAMIGNI